MRIAFFSPILRYGGDVTNAFEIAKKLANDHKVVFINSEISKKYQRLKKIPFKVKFLKDIKYPLLNFISPYFYLPRYYEIFQDFDIIHSSTPRLNMLASKIKKNLGIPFIYSTHMVPRFSFNSYQIENTLLYFLVSDWLRRGIKNANAVITPTNFVRNLLKRKFNVNSIVIPNGINKSLFLRSPDQNYKRKLNMLNKRIILFVGQIRESKGIHILIKALNIVKQKVPDIILLCIGESPSPKNNKYYLFLKKLIKKLGLEQSVKFLGSIPFEQLISTYSIADLFVLPSLSYEYQGIVLLEAMSSNVPVVASDSGGIPDMIIDGKNGLLFKNGDYIELSDKMIEILENSDLKNNLIKCANEIIDKKYKWEIIVKKTLKIYKKFA